VVDLGKYNLAVGVIHRGPTNLVFIRFPLGKPSLQCVDFIEERTDTSGGEL
jgi:hypothetical protein